MTKRGFDGGQNGSGHEPDEISEYFDDSAGKTGDERRAAGVRDVGGHSNVVGGSNFGPMARRVEVFNQYLVTEAAGLDTVGRLLLSDRQRARWRDHRWLRPRFVPPGGYPTALDILTHHHFVVLTGAAGSGRSSAALMALAAASEHAAAAGTAATAGGSSAPSAASVDTGVIRIRDLPGPGHSGFTADNWPMIDDISRGECLRLDLTLAPGLSRDNVERLVDLMHAVRDSEAWLAVTASDQVYRSLTAEISALRAPMTRPDAAALLAAHLHADKVVISLEDIRLADERNRLESLNAETVARIAQLALSSPEIGPAGRIDWLSKAIEAVVGDVLRVYDAYANQFTQRGAGSDQDVAVWRIRVACVAMLEGATYPIISFAEKELVRISDPSDPPEKSAHPFSLEDMTEWLDTVQAAPDPNGIAWSRPVRFKQLSLGAALRRYFWEFNPHLVDIYLDWFDQLAAGLSRYREGSEALARLAERIIELTVDSGEGTDLLLLAQRWMERPERPHHLAATMALRRGLDDERASVLFRQAFYDWSRDARLPPHAALLVIGLCKELAVDLPDLAITRLWHFMAHPVPRTGSAAADSMLLLGRSTERYKKVFTKIATHLAERGATATLRAPNDSSEAANRFERQTSRAVGIFLELAETERLRKAYPDAFGEPGLEVSDTPVLSPETRSGRPMIEMLPLAWRMALAVGRPGALVPRLRDWLAAAGTPGYTHVIDVLVEACGNRLRIRNALINHAWTCATTGEGDPAMGKIFEDLLDRLVLAADSAAPGADMGDLDQDEEMATK